MFVEPQTAVQLELPLLIAPMSNPTIGNTNVIGIPIFCQWYEIAISLVPLTSFTCDLSRS